MRGSIFDSSGNFYFSDADPLPGTNALGGRLRKVAARTIDGLPQPIDGSETITAFAGTGAPGFLDGPALDARFNSCRGLAFDATEENLYIADTGNNRIRKVDMTADPRTVANVVGNGEVCPVSATSRPPCGDGGAALEGQVTAPTAVDVDSQGNLWISMAFNRVRMVDTSQILSTVAGTGTTGFSGDGGPAGLAQFNSLRGSGMDGADNYYV